MTAAVLTKTALSAVVENESAELVRVDVSVVGLGLDQRLARHQLGRFTLDPHSAQRIEVPLAALPIQSVRTPAQMQLEIVYTREGHIQHLPAPQPLYVQFAPDYRVAYVSGVDPWGPLLLGMAAGDLRDPRMKALTDPLDAIPRRGEDPAATLAFMRDMMRPFAEPQGRFEDSSGRVVDVRRLGHEGAVAYGSAFVAKNGLADAIARALGSQPLLPPRGIPSRVCAEWAAYFQDSGFGEDFLDQTSWQFAPASYAKAALITENMENIWEGVLDADGCTPDIAIELGQTLILHLQPWISHNASTFDVVYSKDDKTLVANRLSLLQTFTVELSPTDVISITPAWEDPSTRVAAVVSRIMVMDDNGLLPGIYEVRADSGCPHPPPTPPSDACMTNNAVFLGFAEGTWHTTLSKYVIAHEVGHLVQQHGSGVPGGEYAMSASQPACRCDHVSPSIRSHCLQSREGDTDAAYEGWAHFYAARAFNNAADADCTFVYYKAFREDSGAIINPPFARSCLGAVHWERDHCPAPQQGTEYDWLVFFYGVNTQTTWKSSIGDLYAIFKQACSGFCDKKRVHWSDLSQAAKVHYGMTSQFAYFDGLGTSFGIGD